MSRAVVWDSNVYRSLTEKRFEELLELERRRRIAPWADPWVIVELLAHLADLDDPALTSCRRALRRIYTRCADGKRLGRPGGLIRDSEAQITEMITGRPLPGHAETTRVLGDLCHTVGITPSGEPLPFNEKDVRWIAEHVVQTEDWFANHARGQRERVEVLLAQVQGESERRLTRAAAMEELERSGTIRTAIAEAIMRGAYKDVGLKAPEPFAVGSVEQVRKTLAVGIEFHTQLLRRVVYDGANMDAARNRNLIWDQRISYCIGQEVGGELIWFITDDPAFHAAAAAAGYPRRVRRLAAYENWLRGKRHGLRRPR